MNTKKTTTKKSNKTKTNKQKQQMYIRYNVAHTFGIYGTLQLNYKLKALGLAGVLMGAFIYCIPPRIHEYIIFSTSNKLLSVLYQNKLTIQTCFIIIRNMEISYLLSKTCESTNHHAFFNVKCCVMIDLLFNILAYSILILSAC